MELREKILVTAIEQFRQTGLKFTMQDVAEQARISKKTIYTVFASKEELLLGMLDYGYEKIQERKKEIISADMDLRDRLRLAMIALPEEYEIDRFIFLRQLDGLKEQYPAVHRALHRHLEDNWEPVLELLAQGRKCGLIRPVAVPVLRLMITASIESFIDSDLLNQSDISYEQALNEMIDIIMKGICVK